MQIQMFNTLKFGVITLKMKVRLNGEIVGKK
jgi:hypothetical protein